MKRLTFKLQGEEQELIYEETYDANNNVIYYKDYQAYPIVEKHISYDSEGIVIEEIEFSGGKELDRLSFKIDAKGKIVEQCHYIDGELFEQSITDFSETGFIKRTFQEKDEVERLERKNVDENKYVNTFYESDKAVEKHYYEFDTSNRIGITKIYDTHNTLLAIRREVLDAINRLLVSQEFTRTGDLLQEVKFEYQGGVIVKETYRQFFENEHDDLQLFYSFDNAGNQISKQVKSPSGQLLEFHHKEYDLNNRVIKETGYSNGSFDAIFGYYFNNSKFNIIHIYEE